jgi:hypothetical protein
MLKHVPNSSAELSSAASGGALVRKEMDFLNLSFFRSQQISSIGSLPSSGRGRSENSACPVVCGYCFASSNASADSAATAASLALVRHFGNPLAPLCTPESSEPGTLGIIGARTFRSGQKRTVKASFRDFRFPSEQMLWRRQRASQIERRRSEQSGLQERRCPGSCPTASFRSRLVR